MSIKKLYLIIYTITGAVLLALGTLIGLIVRNQNALDDSQTARYQSYLLADELRQSSDELTRLARTYVATGKEQYEKMYWDVLAVRNGEKPRPDGRTISLKALMKEAGFTEEEFAKLKAAEDNSNDLVTTETIAINAMKGLFRDSRGNFVKQAQPVDSAVGIGAGTAESAQAFALRIMFDEKYVSDKAKIMRPVDEFFGLLTNRTNQAVEVYTVRGKWYLTLSIGLFALVILVMALSYFLIQKRVLSRLAGINQEAQRILEGDFSATLEDASADEIGILAKGINNLSEGLRQKADFAIAIGSGKLSAEYKPLSGKDTLGHSLLEMRDSLKKVAEEDAKRNWATEGLAKFSETLRTNNDLQHLGDLIIADLVKYVKACQGGLFTVNDAKGDDIRLELLSCYAFNRKKYLEKSIPVGEGLVGQAYLEGEKIYLTDIPQEYVKITSGLGEANPSALLIVPLKVNDKIEGVIEIASFHPFEPHEITFVEKLSENIASALASVKINARTIKLLEESQLQTEAMRAQEEEMRQNMEELQATQEEVARRQQEVSDLLERFNLAAQTTTEGLWDMKVPENLVLADDTYFWCADRFRHMLGFANEYDFPNRLHSWTRLLHPDHQEKFIAGLEAHLSDFSGKTPYDVECRLQLKNGQYKWFRAIGNTSRDSQGKPIRVSGSLIDIQVIKDLEKTRQENEKIGH